MVAECEHEWRWLERPTFTVGSIEEPSEAVNVECARCGARTWAHGTMPDARLATVPTNPTTGRT